MTRIVTSTYRYKRPPRKRKAVAFDVPAVVTRKRAVGSAKSVGAADRLPEQPANDDRKSAIVATTSRKLAPVQVRFVPIEHLELLVAVLGPRAITGTPPPLRQNRRANVAARRQQIS
jgi:hypothetical protein